jgi:F-type H+-transporting ATPase subunit epsilon
MAEAHFQLRIVTPEGVQLNESVDELTAPSVFGQFGVLPGHRPMLAALSTGIISYTQGGAVTQVAVGAGYVDINGDRAVVLTDRFSTKAAVDPVRVRLELKEVDAALDATQSQANEAPSGAADALGGPEHIELVSRELWAAALLELHGDPPPPTLRGFEEARLAENYLVTALDRNSTDESDPSGTSGVVGE